MTTEELNTQLIQTYDRLANYFISGELALVTLNAIRQEYEDKIETPNDLFIMISIVSTFNTSILVLANTMHPNKDSIHLPYLVDLIKKSSEGFEAKTYNALVSFINEFEAELSRISKIIDYVVLLRDKNIAHLDQKHIKNPSFFLQNPPMEWDQLTYAYAIVENGLLEIGKYLGNGISVQDHVTLANFFLKNRVKEIYRALMG